MLELYDSLDFAPSRTSESAKPLLSAKTLFEQRMGVDDAIMQKVLAEALSRGGNYADLYFEYSTHTSIVLEEKVIKTSSLSIVMGVGIRVLHGEQTGYAYSEELSLTSMLHAARSAASIASRGNVSLHEGFKFNEQISPDYYKILHSTTDLNLIDKVALIRQAEEAAHEYDARIDRVTVSVSDTLEWSQVATSEGLICRDVRPMFQMNVLCVALDGEKRQTGTAGTGGRVGQEFLKKENHSKALGRKAAADAILMLDAEQAPSGQMPVILGPAQSGILLHEAVGHPLEADFNRKGTSAYSGRIGEKVASSLCTIYDTGTIPNDRGSINFDDEAHSPKKSVLIENGVLTGYMHDRISADFFKTEVSGNGRRESYAHYPVPRMTSTYLANGESDPDEILHSVKKGIYCQSFNGGQVDISNGNFVFVPTIAYLVEDGKLTVPIKNFTLIGNGPEVMSKVTQVGNDFAMSEGIWTCSKDGQNVPVGIGQPTVLISQLTVGGI